MTGVRILQVREKGPNGEYRTRTETYTETVTDFHYKVDISQYIYPFGFMQSSGRPISDGRDKHLPNAVTVLWMAYCNRPVDSRRDQSVSPRPKLPAVTCRSAHEPRRPATGAPPAVCCPTFPQTGVSSTPSPKLRCCAVQVASDAEIRSVRF